MNAEIQKQLSADPDGLLTYEYIANHIDTCAECIDMLIDNMIKVDRNGQFIVSAARYLTAIDAEGFRHAIDRLVSSAIEKDREHRYLPDLLEGVYGPDYALRADILRATDDNFRRIEKRLNPKTAI